MGVTNKIEPDTSAGGAQPEPTKKPKKPKKMEDDKSRAIMTLLADTVEKAPTPAVLSSVVGGISTLVLINEDEEEPAPEDDEVTADQDKQVKKKGKVQISPEVKLEAAKTLKTAIQAVALMSNTREDENGTRGGPAPKLDKG